MAGKVNWNGEAFKREVLSGLQKRVAAASIYLASQVKADISQPGTLRTTAKRRGKKGRFKSQTIYNFTHSAPGNPPYKQTGRLRASIAWELAGARGLIGRVGTNVKYSRWLELGTKRMAARPYLRSALRKHRPALAAILNRTIQPGGLPAIGSNQFRSGILGRGARRMEL